MIFLLFSATADRTVYVNFRAYTFDFSSGYVLNVIELQ